MNLTKSEIQIEVNGETFPVSVIKQDGRHYYNANDILAALGFEKPAARTVKDWLRTGANDLRQYGIKMKSQHYMCEVYESVFAEKSERIALRYPNQAEAVAAFRIDPNAVNDVEFIPIAEQRAKAKTAVTPSAPAFDVLPDATEEITLLESEPISPDENEARKSEIEKRELSRELQLLETRNRINFIFTNPVSLTLPLFAVIIASGIHMAVVFMGTFQNDLASVMLAFVFSSVVLVFTFNSADSKGTIFVYIFALIECLLNAVYFSLFPDLFDKDVGLAVKITKVCATLGLPLALVAYAYLFKRFTKDEKN